MEKSDDSSKENATVILNVISKLVEDFEKKVSKDNVKAKGSDELQLLREKCCSKNVMESLTAFQGIQKLVERRILVASQAVSILVSLLPSINNYGALVSTVGNILFLDLRQQLSSSGSYQSHYDKDLQHPFVMILKFNKEKSWFEVYLFIQQLMMSRDIEFEHTIKLLSPVFQLAFWNSSWRGSQLQLKLFSLLMMQFEDKNVLNFTLEMLVWQQMDIYFCLFLQEIFLHFLKERTDESKLILSALTPQLAQAIKWLILGGHDPTVWINLLMSTIQVNKAAASSVLYMLTDVIKDTPSVYINLVIDVCKSIICSSSCNKYVAHKFVAVVLNWFIHPTSLANPMYRTGEEIFKFLDDGFDQPDDQTSKLLENEFYRKYGNVDKDVKFAVDLIDMSNSWSSEPDSVHRWLKNLKESNENRIQLKLHSFLYGIILCENDNSIVDSCLEILLKLINLYKYISFSLLCFIFYKLGRETDPIKQRSYLFSLPALAVKKENIPLIMRIIESLSKGSPKIMTPLVLKLYLSLWEIDARTYPYLHKMLHDGSSENSSWELNVGKALALRQLCRRDPHLYAKNLVAVLSKILNECFGQGSGLPSAIAIEAVTELCKAYVIDVSGTWNAIRPKLSVDKRSKVIVSLCRFFAEISALNISEKNFEHLICDAVPMLWNYTFVKDDDVVKHAFQALSAFKIENLPLKLFPEIYKNGVKMPEELGKHSAKDSGSGDDVQMLPYVPAECWVKFILKVDEKVLKHGGSLLIAMIERELESLPRGYFYLPPERSEPTSYSYLPSRSIIRALVTYLQKQSASDSQRLKEITRILSFEYPKLLPPLNWSFVENLMKVDVEFWRHSLMLLAKQGSVSESSRSILDSYFKTVQWDSGMLEEIVFLYSFLPQLCKALQYNVLQNFLETTIEICLLSAVQDDTHHFAKNLESMTEALKNKCMPPSHKTLIAKQLKKVLVKIPPSHRVMESYAICATEFPVQSIENLTSVQSLSDVDGDWLRRACLIKSAISMRENIKYPLVWLNDIIDAAGGFPDEQIFILKRIFSIIRNRRSCDHTKWLQELMWKIQASIVNFDSDGAGESYDLPIFLINVFISATVALSGYDVFFVDENDFATDTVKKLQLFPQSLEVLFRYSEWSDLLPKVTVWLQKLVKWKHLPQDYLLAFSRSRFKT